MDFNEYLLSLSNLSKSEIVEKAAEYAGKINDIRIPLDIESDLSVPLFDVAVVFAMVNGRATSTGVKFITALDDEMITCEYPESTVTEFNDSYRPRISTYMEIVNTVASLVAKFAPDSVYNEYSDYTDGRRAHELFIDFCCLCVVGSGTVGPKAVALLQKIETIINETPVEESNDVEVVDEPEQKEYPAPRVVKVGGTIFRGEYDTYFSVGAEIEIEEMAVFGLDIRIQLLDETGFILETEDETIDVVEPGIFYFGKEYTIECMPSSFKVVVGARDRGEIKEQYVPSKIFKTTGMRFINIQNDWHSPYGIACMVESINRENHLIGTEMFCVFYDSEGYIVGGSVLVGNDLYYGQPDRYSERIDAQNVVAKTASFRWSLDVEILE